MVSTQYTAAHRWIGGILFFSAANKQAQVVSRTKNPERSIVNTPAWNQSF